jgi:hypothetical protein
MKSETTGNGQAIRTPGEGREERAAAPALQWQQESDGHWRAPNTAGIRSTEEPKFLAAFDIAEVVHEGKTDHMTFVIAGDVQLMPDPAPGPFLSLDGAKECAERRNAELVAAAQPACTDVPNNDTSTPAAEPKAEEKVGSKPIDPENLSRQLRAIERQEKTVGKLRDEWENLKELTASAKKAYDEGVERLCEIIRRHNAPAPLFDDPSLRQPAATSGAEPTAPAEDDAWRSVLIADLEPKLTAGKLKVLAEHVPPITTMGEMADWQKAKGDFWVKDLKGFGPGGAEQYELAATRYFEEHPREPKAPAEAPATDATAPPTESEPSTNQFEQALAAAPDDIDPHTANRVASFVGDNARFTIEVAQRANGQCAEQHTARIGDGRKHTCDSTGWQGRHVTRGEAIAAAADTIDEWAKGLRGTSSSVTAGVKEIRKELDKLDRAHADDPGGAADSNRQAVAV